MINVIGLGYIGLPTALILAAHENKVVGTDLNHELVSTLKAGKTTFKEEGLDDLFKKAIHEGITFETKYIVTNTYIVTVPTPYEKAKKRLDPTYVINAVSSILNVCLDGTTIVLESTVSPGTIDNHIRPLLEKIDKKIFLVHAPERILPGNMISELKNNSRTIGADDIKVGNRIKALYASFCDADIVVTDIKTAEMSKVVENTYRDINIAFANELSKICRSDDMDVHEIIKIANMHPRVNILNPGPGVGGHCISVDPWFLVGDYPELTKLISTAREVNDSMPDFVLNRISEIMVEKNITDQSRVGLYGLTYKQDVDDIRESPTIQLLESMEKHLAKPLKSFDPMLKKIVVENQFDNFESFISDIDLVVVMVAHKHLLDNTDLLIDKVVLDTQNIIKNSYKL